MAGSVVFADDSVVDEINITVPVSCTISGTGMNTHNANINNGIYTNNIGTTTLHAFCNDSEGFAIYAAGFTGDEVGGTNSNKLVGTAASGNATIETGLATTAGNPDVSNWAIKLAITQDSGDTTGTNAFTIDSAPNVTNGADATFSQYHVVPNEYTKVAHKNSGTDMAASTGGVKLTTTYAAYISKTQPADTYSGQVIYTLVHPSNHVTPVACNPNATIISEAKCMQDFAGNAEDIISSMTPEQQYTLKDKRDGKTYTIAKFATCPKESCGGGPKSIAQNNIKYTVWMTQNLDLDLDARVTYTNGDTDIGYNTTTREYDTATWTPIRSTYSATNTQAREWCAGGTRNPQYGYCESNSTPESYDPGNLYWNGLIDNGSLDWSVYEASCDENWENCDSSLMPTVSSTGIAQYHLGNYYNWAAALATNDSSVYNSSSVFSNRDLVEQSICPVGWTLPRIGDDEDSFSGLWNQYNLASNSYIDANSNDQYDTGEIALWTSPLYFVVSGDFFDDGPDGVGYASGFWSSIAVGKGDAGRAGFDVGGDVYPDSASPRHYGGSVRCVARPVAGAGSEPGGGGDPEGPFL